MAGEDTRSEVYQSQAARLLARGGRILGLSAVAKAHGQRPGMGPWFVLSSNMVAAAEEILAALEQEIDPVVLEAVVQAAMDLKPATASPGWAESFWRDPEALSRVGRTLGDRPCPELLVARESAPLSDRKRGLACLAVALGRSLDGLRSLAGKLPESDRIALVRMGHLANVLAKPGEPTQMRGLLRQLVAQEGANG